MLQRDLDIVTHLYCPCCGGVSTPPITSCINGHNICKFCTSIYKKCPMCLDSYAGRNKVLEEIQFQLKVLKDSLPGEKYLRLEQLKKESFQERNKSMLKLVRILKQQLVCRMCNKAIYIPIMFCCDGHLVCPEHETCPYCKKKKAIKNIAIENIVKNINLVCPLHKFGCITYMSFKGVDHIYLCKFNTLECPVEVNDNPVDKCPPEVTNTPVCKRKMPLKYLFSHLRDKKHLFQGIYSQLYSRSNMTFCIDMKRCIFFYVFNGILQVHMIQVNRTLMVRFRVLGCDELYDLKHCVKMTLKLSLPACKTVQYHLFPDGKWYREFFIGYLPKNETETYDILITLQHFIPIIDNDESNN